MYFPLYYGIEHQQIGIKIMIFFILVINLNNFFLDLNKGASYSRVGGRSIALNHLKTLFYLYHKVVSFLALYYGIKHQQIGIK